MLVGHYDGDHVFGIAPVYNALTANRRNITELLIQEVHLLTSLAYLLTNSLTQGMDVNNKKDDKVAGDIIKIAGTKGIPIREFSRHDLNMMTDNKVLTYHSLTHSLTIKNLFDKFSLVRCTRGLYYERSHYNLQKWKQWKHVTSLVAC